MCFYLYYLYLHCILDILIYCACVIFYFIYFFFTLFNSILPPLAATTTTKHYIYRRSLYNRRSLFCITVDEVWPTLCRIALIQPHWKAFERLLQGSSTSIGFMSRLWPNQNLNFVSFEPFSCGLALVLLIVVLLHTQLH